MPRRNNTVERRRLEGFIEARRGERLEPVWKAFRVGGTWEGQGKRSARRARYRHIRHGGRIRLEWWGKAIRFEIDDAERNGLIVGAFTGHVCRHGANSVDRLDIRFV